MISKHLAVLIAAAVSERFPAFDVRVITWGNELRYEAIARDPSATRVSALITDDAGELVRTLQRA